MGWEYGTVDLQIPIIQSESLKSNYAHLNSENNGKFINDKTPTLILTPETFYFGNLEAFTTKFYDVREKFYVTHIDGQPQLSELIKDMKSWLKEKNISNNSKVLVLLPTNNVPIPIVTQVIHWLKHEKIFEDVVLASELI